MQGIEQFLVKFKNILFKKGIEKKSIIEAVNLVTGIKIKEQDIRIKDGTIYLEIKPIYKNEIFLKREKIIDELKKTIGQKSPEEIR